MNIKYFFSLTLIICFTQVGFAQNSKVQSARLAYNDAVGVFQGGDIEAIGQEDLDKIKNYLTKAVEYIEPATKHEKSAPKEKTWRYRGDIYQLLSRFLSKPGFSEVSPDPIRTAADSYAKAMELDSKGSSKAENIQGLTVMENISVNEGINKYNASDFAGAFKHFDAACMIADQMGIVDSTAIFNAGLSADRAEDMENAAKYYRKAIDMNFPDPGLFKFLYDSKVKMGQKEAAFDVLKEGLTRHPNNQGLMIDLVNVYLQDDRLEEALAYLEKSVTNDPDNAVLNYSVGSVYDNLGRKEDARTAYVRALEIDPEYFEANYNLGASYYNEAAAMVKEANDLPPSKKKEFDAGIEKANGLFNKALPYLEKAHQLDAEDPSTIQSLKEIYVRLKMTEKYKSLK